MVCCKLVQAKARRHRTNKSSCEQLGQLLPAMTAKIVQLLLEWNLTSRKQANDFIRPATSRNFLAGKNSGRIRIREEGKHSCAIALPGRSERLSLAPISIIHLL